MSSVVLKLFLLGNRVPQYGLVRAIRVFMSALRGFDCGFLSFGLLVLKLRD